MNENIPCKYCLMDIPYGAKKCHICEEFQVKKGVNPLKTFGAFVKDISGVVTAAGVIFGLVTVLDYLPSQQVSKISAYDASSDPSQFTFIFRNDGLRSAFLGPIRIQIDYLETAASGAAGFRSGQRILEAEKSIVKPGSEVVVSLDFQLTKHIENPAEGCEVIAEIWDYNATEPRHVRFERPCDAGSIGSKHSVPKSWKRTPADLEL